MNNLYLIRYSQIKTELLDKRYDTACFNYDIDYKHANFNMRSDCITHCYQRKMNKQVYHSSVKSFAPSQYLHRADAFDQVPNNFTDHPYLENQDIKSKIKLECLDECPKDCKLNYYSMDVDKYKKLNETEKFEFYLEHDNMPDISITHIPEFSFISLVCNLGGLIGMWLGISILVIFDEIYNNFVQD